MSKACFLNFRLIHLLSLGKSREQEGTPQRVLTRRAQSQRQRFMRKTETEEGQVHKRLRGKCLKISFHSEWEITLLGKEYRGKIYLLMARSREGFKCQSSRKFRKTKSSMPFSYSIQYTVWGENKHAHAQYICIHIKCNDMLHVCANIQWVYIACMCMQGMLMLGTCILNQ